MRVMLVRGEPRYQIETVVKISEDMLKSYEASEDGFSPNPFDPVIVYSIETDNVKAKEFFDYILKRE